MSQIDTSLTVTNNFDIKGQAILALIAQYVPGFVGQYYGFRPIGSNDLSFPCVMVTPSSVAPVMRTTGKFYMAWQYNIYWYVVSNNPTDIVSLSTFCAEALIKLFSNDALGTISNQYKSYAGFWISSEMKSVELSQTYINAVPQNFGKYMRAGVMRFEVQDQFLI